jgi:flagellar hook protein FlgE
VVLTYENLLLHSKHNERLIMAISSAMQAAVAGLSANATAVGKVSENIANSNTVGYKRQFASMVTTASASPGGSGGSGVRAEGRQEVTGQGQASMTSSGNDLSIGGEGFFIVSKNPNDAVESNYMFTRAGSFVPDENGYLKNAAGFYLAGFGTQADGTVGAVDYTNFTTMESVRVSDVSQTAEASTTSSMQGNLPSGETGTGTATAPFLSTMQYFTPLGDRDSMSFSWQADPLVANQWQATVTGSDGTVYGTADVVFNDSGPTAGSPQSFAGTQDAGLAAPAAFSVSAAGVMTLTINNGAVPQTINLTLGSVGGYDGLTQFAGDYTPQTFETDGSSVTLLESTEFDESGILWGVFDNGTRSALYQIPLGMVDNPDGLASVDGNAYRLSRDSGDMILTGAGQNGAGAISSFSLESSNVDVAKEMTDLIQIQRAYSSNAKVITTADEMLQETTNLKR